MKSCNNLKNFSSPLSQDLWSINFGGCWLQGVHSERKHQDCHCFFVYTSRWSIMIIVYFILMKHLNVIVSIPYMKKLCYKTKILFDFMLCIFCQLHFAIRYIFVISQMFFYVQPVLLQLFLVVYRVQYDVYCTPLDQSYCSYFACHIFASHCYHCYVSSCLKIWNLFRCSKCFNLDKVGFFIEKRKEWERLCF